ncbi:monooxygenase, partial [Candidatus Acetothermia bacterium]|nr:monooxygenase [Candidatus Acetothermia bacterium]
PSSAPPRPGERTPDRTIIMDPPYLPNKTRADDYRCFLLDPQLERDTLVSGYRVYPGQKSLVHHVILFVIGPDAVAAAEARDRAESGPGWTCYGGPGISGAGAGALSNSLGFWVPGGDGTDFPHKSARLLRAGSRIIMQVHYHTTHVTSDSYDATKVGLFLAPEGAQLAALQGMILAAPVEIRCPGPYPTDSIDPCHREAAMRRAEFEFAALSDAIHQICGTSVQEYLQREIGNGSAQPTKCDWRVRQNGLALGVVSHMHLRGAATRIELNPDTPQAKILLDIPRWDFNWQGNYWFQEPISLKAGDRVRIVCVYDNSRAILGPDRQMVPPRYMIWGEGTLDEMCLGALAFIRE